MLNKELVVLVSQAFKLRVRVKHIVIDVGHWTESSPDRYPLQQ